MPLTPPPTVLEWPQREEWLLDWSYLFLNNGSFGAVPRRVLASAEVIRRKIEGHPIEWLGRKNAEVIEPTRIKVCQWTGADPAGTAFVTNATSGVGAFLRSIQLSKGDSIVTSTHVYNAVRKYAAKVAAQWGADYREIDIPLPVSCGAQFADRLMGGVDRSTRVVIVDHITSPTAFVLPVADIARRCRELGIACLVDGAHAIGQVPVDVPGIGADLYTSNLHKWAFAPKGSAFVSVSTAMQSVVRPETISHFVEDGFRQAFDWQGTRDIAAWGAAADGLAFLEQAGGARLMGHNRQMARFAHDLLCSGLHVDPIGPEDGAMMAAMATVRLPAALRTEFGTTEKLAQSLYSESRIEVPIIDWGGNWFVRVSAQAYNRSEEYECLLRELLKRMPVREARAGSPVPA